MVRMPVVLLSLSADAGQVAESELGERFRQNVERQSDQAVGLFHVTGYLGQIAVCGQTHRTAHHGAYALADARLDLAAQFERRKQRTLAAHETTGHLVNGEHGGDGETALDRFDDAVVVVDVDLVARLDQDQAGTHPLGFGHDGTGSDAVRLGLITGGDAAGCVGHHGYDSHGLTAQLGAILLLDRGKIGIEIDEEPVEAGAGVGLPGGRRGLAVRKRESV
jgi:hypothetical protein